MPKLFEIPITYVVTNDVEKWRRRKELIHYNFITKKSKIISPDVDLERVAHQQQIEKLKKIKMQNMNTIITAHNMFIMRRFIMMRRLIRKNWIGY